MKRLKLKILVIIGIPLFLLTNCTNEPKDKNEILNHDILSECNLAIQNAVVLDGVTPPVAARRYFYSCVAAFEAIQPLDSNLVSTTTQFNGLDSIIGFDPNLNYCGDLVALIAYTSTAKAIVYREDSINAFRERKLEYYKNKLDASVYKNSIEWGEKVSVNILNWAKTDTFEQIRGRDLYLAKNSPLFWQPTPSEYMQAIEPQWMHIRPNLIDSASQFRSKLPEPAAYELNESGESINPEFNKLMREVYNESLDVDSQEILMARYWDDNPNSTFHYGHATIKVLKVSPAGHWLSMFSTVSRQKNYSLFESAEGMLRVSAAMFDGFIGAWEAKYHYEYIRPVTVIRRHIDSAWLPAIETPAFPEYPSAHSVVSSAAATVLTNIFGEYEFIDSAENEFGMGIRKFSNFREASDEACMSRLYGGIHFREGIEYGKLVGNAIGDFHNEKLKTRVKD